MDTPRLRTSQTFEEIADHLALGLLAKLKDGSATAADRAIAAQLLKDVGVTLLPAAPVTTKLARALPFPGEEDDRKPIQFPKGNN